MWYTLVYQLFKEFIMGAKNLFYFTAAALLDLKKTIESKVEALSDKGQSSVDELKTSIDKQIEKGKELDLEYKDRLKNELKQIIDELGIATKEDLEKLKKELQH